MPWKVISSVSGSYYGYDMLRHRETAEYALRFWLGSPFLGPQHLSSQLILCADYRDAVERAERFVRCFQKWNVVLAQRRAFAQGFGVVGGFQEHQDGGSCECDMCRYVEVGV